MTTDTTPMTDNEVICRFLGNKEIVVYGKLTGFQVVFGYRNGPTDLYNLEYNTSWDWLMPVWYKFRDLEGHDLKLSEYKEYRYYWHSIANDIPRKPISDVCKLLTEGIRWYNSIKQ